MSRLRMILTVKAAFTFFVLALPLLFMPLEGFQLLGFPEYDPPVQFFIRLLGAAMVTISVVALFASFDPTTHRGGLIALLVDCLGALIVIWHEIFYGGMSTWPVRGKLIAVLFGLVQLGFLIGLLLTGW